MAITTLDGLVAGFKAPVPFMKTTGTMTALTFSPERRGHSLWYVGTNPGAATANAVGINGAAVSGATAGALPRTNPGSGNAYLGRLTATASVTGKLWLIDRLWHNSGISVTSTTAQAITPAALPARSGDGTSNGKDVMAALEWSTASGAGFPTVTLTYTDQDGNTGATATVNGVNTVSAGAFEIFQLAAGDTGVRAPTSIINDATRTSGTVHLVLFRLIAEIDLPLANAGNSLDAMSSGMPQIYNDSVLQLVWFPSATGTTNIVGTYIETQG